MTWDDGVGAGIQAMVAPEEVMEDDVILENRGTSSNTSGISVRADVPSAGRRPGIPCRVGIKNGISQRGQVDPGAMAGEFELRESTEGALTNEGFEPVTLCASYPNAFHAE